MVAAVIGAASKGRVGQPMADDALVERVLNDLAKYFEGQATRRASDAVGMLLGAAISLALLLGTLAVLTVGWPLAAGNDWVTLVRDGTPRLLALGVFAYAVRFCVRNYTINKHLQVTYELRANILRTYPAFVFSLGDDLEKRGRIAIVVAQAAISAIETGYLTLPEDKGLENQLQAVRELVRDFK
jgi:hypothetical protein